MLRRVIVALVAACIAGGALIGYARVAEQDRRDAARERADTIVDEQAARIDARLDALVDTAVGSLRLRCAHPELDAIHEPGIFAVDEPHDGVMDRLRPYHIIEDDTGQDGIAVVHACSDRQRVLVRVWTFDQLAAALTLVGHVRLVGASGEPAPFGSSVRQQTIRRAGVPDIVTWATIEPVAREPRVRASGLAGMLALAMFVLAMLGGASPRVDRKLEAAARRVGEGDLDVTLDGSSPTASAFNRMTRELRDARTRLARAERIAAWRDIARRIAHEIKNPLTPIKMSMETLRKTHARKHPDFDEIFDESTKTVLEETARLERIVTEFSRFARMPRPKAESLDVTDVALKVVAMHDLPAAAATRPEAAKGVRVELVQSERLPSVRADAEQLTQVLVNLVQNACDAAREKQGDTGGRVIVRLERAENDAVRIVVSDNGPGIPMDSRNAVLEPYYTTKVLGTGLGLAIVDRIVSDHGGALALGDSELGGAEVTITLRREGPADEPESSAMA